MEGADSTIMSRKTNFSSNGHDYFRVSKVIGHDPKTGKPIVKQFTGKSKKEAEAKRDEYMNKLRSGFTTETFIFGTIANFYISKVFLKDSKRKDTTKDLYISAWNKIIEPSKIYSMNLNDVDYDKLQDIYDDSTAAYSTRNAAHKLMKLFYRWLDDTRKHRDITKSLVVHRKEIAPKDDDVVITWTEGELKAILNGFEKADPRFRLKFLIILGIYSGCRISELLALKYTDFRNGNIYINKQLSYKKSFDSDDEKKSKSELMLSTPKTDSSSRTIPIHPAIEKALKKHMAWHKREMKENGYATEYVFTSNTGNFLDRHDVYHALDTYYSKIGVEHKKFHAYRATFATMLACKGIPIHTVADLLGHSDVRVTLKYYVNVPKAEKVDAINTIDL